MYFVLQSNVDLVMLQMLVSEAICNHLKDLQGLKPLLRTTKDLKIISSASFFYFFLVHLSSSSESIKYSLFHIKVYLNTILDYSGLFLKDSYGNMQNISTQCFVFFPNENKSFWNLSNFTIGI